MAEYSKEKLYFLKMPKDFFQGHYMRALEGVPNGRDYELMYLKLMLESTAYNGWLRLSEGVAYSETMIAGITNTPLDTVRVGLKVLEGFGLVTRNNDGSLFLPQVPELTGFTTEGAERRKGQRERQLSMKRGQLGDTEGDKCRPLVTQEIKRTRDLDRNKNSMGTPNVVHQESSSLIKPDITGLKQKALCEMLVEAGYVREEDLQDPQWDDFLDECVREHKYVNTKIKLEYFIARTCHMRKVGEDEYGNGIVRREFRYESEPIQKRFCYMVAAMQEAFDRMDGGDEDGQ